jgi:phosphoenolpyruvate---glycerone phosphotransferase subunit DhaL
VASALILDCDGVIADTERYGHLVAFNQTFAGDKTLLDALVPVVDTIEERARNGESAAAALKAAALVAREHAEATRGMLAKRGRAAYTGERSIGTLDAGAIAVAVMFEALADEWARRSGAR